MLTRAKKYLLMAAGVLALLLAVAGIVLPLLPTTPWVIVAAFCFAKAEPKWEKRLLDHPRFGPYIIAWRDRQAIPRLGKIAAGIMLIISAVVGWWRLPLAWAWLPTLVAIVVGSWIWTRPDN
ncbi:YbaN family protein [Permianibacter sp. IMCC34836]|uniref:YbaN family protein n=1 Tax=Permianibacter fluminis TaxID=2738515 RepID=UPI0015545477|nr:YbaN family protein [Permianibacter fluminis]NQD37150.1 YbaN family protein [Permianibacter fluminis]